MPSRRARTLVAAWLALAALLCAPAASADPADDASFTTARFLDALALGDAEAICRLFSPTALQRLGGEAKCKNEFTETGYEDEEAFETLFRAAAAARKSANRRHAGYVTKRFSARALARDIERLDSELTVKLGKGPRTASGQLVTTVVLDLRSSARRVVVYAESDDGSIFRLSAPRKGPPSLDEVAQGTPEAGPPPPPTPSFRYSIDSVAFVGDLVYVHVSVLALEGLSGAYPIMLVLVPAAGGGYLVDDLLPSAFPPVGSGQ